MPITFLNDRYRLQRLGRIRLGHKETKKRKDGTEVQYPVADPFFVIPEDLQELYDPQPTELNIQLIFDSLELAFPHYLRRYTKAGLRCLGDGEQIMYRVNDDGVVDVRDGTAQTEDGKAIVDEHGVIQHAECPGLHCPYYESGECKPTGYLKFIVAERPRMGYYDIVCKQRAVVGVRTALLMCLHTFGRLTDIPFVLHRGDSEKIPVKTPKGMVDMPVRTQWIEIEPTWFASHFTRKREVLAESAQRRRLLAAQASVDLFGAANGAEPSDLALPSPTEQFEEELYSGEAGTAEDTATPVEVEAQLAPEPASTERPRSPALLREFLKGYAANNPHTTINGKARRLLVGKIGEALLDNNGQLRHLFLEYVTGEQSSKKLSPAMVNAMLQWLIAKHDEDTGEYVLDAVAIKELAAVVRQAQPDKDQIDMFAGMPARVGER